MRVTTGRVVNGKIEVPDEEFPEGMVVTILAPEDSGTFTLSPEAETALLASIAEAYRGEIISGEKLLQELQKVESTTAVVITRRAAHEIRTASQW